MPEADDKVICLGRLAARIDMTLIFRSEPRIHVDCTVMACCYDFMKHQSPEEILRNHLGRILASDQESADNP